MKNSIVVSIAYSFKGKELSPSVVIDLDDFCKKGFPVNGLCSHVATANNIDTYSYEYEVVESSGLYFSDATGLAVEYCQNGQFEFEAYAQHLQESEIVDALQKIASEIMNIDDLDKHLDLKQALVRAYREGGQQSIG